MAHFRDMRTPVTLLTGFLGSGKTTLLNGWLRDPALSDAAVIVNEFGEIGIDHALIAASSDNTIELSTGCLCCTVKGDLVETLRDLTEKRARGEVKAFARVIIETTGMADPGPVIQALITFPVARTYRLGRVVTAVDAVQGMGTLDRHAEARKQVGVADEVVLTKADLAGADLAPLEARIAGLSPGARLHLSSLTHLAQPTLLDGIDPADPNTRPSEVRAWLRAEAFEAADPVQHREDIGSFCLAFEEPLHWEHVSAWLDALAIAHGDDLLRVKGILAIAGRSKPVVVQAVQRLFSPPVELSAWPEGMAGSRIVFITRGLSQAYVTEVLDVIRTRPVALDLAS
ncbi:CobW family GTP-binding protein [Xanthobacter aminoxidans]|uniref:CobW family GTP-binding protein n=1 Tax=Xanthobacter aminoxidans TaxID=186280 RepID=UPI002022E49F|nr:GTP-binding protein [Xanthobacter aminoxidans]MCL8383251.1 GTP-binding protein [Xanthobacter aminoxidans]